MRRSAARVENLSRLCRAARWSREKFDAIAETSQFADHLAGSHLLRLRADGRPAFLIAHALVKDLPDQTTEPVGDGSNGLRVPEAWDDAPIHDREDRALRLYGGVGGLIKTRRSWRLPLGQR